MGKGKEVLVVGAVALIVTGSLVGVVAVLRAGGVL